MTDIVLPPVLYHWSPTCRRKGIEREGLKPGKLSVDGSWRPPFVCLATDPMVGWALSGDFHPEVPEWDLWAVRLKEGHHIEVMYDDCYEDLVKEIRVYDRIYKRGVQYVASRRSERAKV